MTAASYFKNLVGFWKISKVFNRETSFLVFSGFALELVSILLGFAHFGLLGLIMIVAGSSSGLQTVYWNFAKARIDLTAEQYNDYGKLYDYYVNENDDKMAELVKYYSTKVLN